MIFNIYYINFPKVYEIKMMLNNILLAGQTVEKDKSIEGEAYLKTKLGFNILDIFKLGEAEAGGNIKGSGSKKVLETFEIKTTKSVILDEVVKNCNKFNGFENVSEGQLIKIDDVKLTLENEAELRMVKFMNSGAMKDFVVPGTNGLDMNNLFNSMFKDYAYKIKGAIKNDENILIKIPLTFESEFESSYSVDDLFVGKVSIIGLYKGKIKIDDLKNSFQYFQELGQLQNTFQTTTAATNTDDSEIEESHYTTNEENQSFSFTSSGDGKEYYYIDLLAIIQNVNIK
ncbi:hypothetical protein J2810_002330 [Chryseobacterium rhizosphaerae]|uniref:hypothetical protein n=1 Tax=Chryseobacterium rhizosphaerae TaxID=395937 RepID=UPI002858CE8F|nr:hypothetical protein [Chryseobacterium rhizosphaerae]MDR6546274.1 hypothetical protein [Chryseobacterium rhizosphaerae]